MCPYLNSSDFYLWGPLKSKVYANNPHSLEELKQNILQEIAATSERIYLKEIYSLPDSTRSSFRT